MPMFKIYLTPDEAEQLEDLGEELDVEARGLDELRPEQDKLVRHILKEAIMWLED